MQRALKLIPVAAVIAAAVAGVTARASVGSHTTASSDAMIAPADATVPAAYGATARRRRSPPTSGSGARQPRSTR